MLDDHAAPNHLFSALQEVSKAVNVKEDMTVSTLEYAAHLLWCFFGEVGVEIDINDGKEEATDKRFTRHIADAIGALSNIVNTLESSTEEFDSSDAVAAVRSINLAATAAQGSAASDIFDEALFMMRHARMSLKAGDFHAATDSINRTRDSVRRLSVSAKDEAKSCLAQAEQELKKAAESAFHRFNLFGCEEELDSAALELSEMVKHMSTSYRYPYEAARQGCTPRQ